MILEGIAIACTGIFSGAAIYVSFVEHPARLSCGVDVALRQWRPSYHLASIMQASLAILGTGAGIVVWWISKNPLILLGAVLLAANVPYTLLAIFPTNKELNKIETEKNSERAHLLLQRWGKLHLVRSILSACSYLILIYACIAK